MENRDYTEVQVSGYYDGYTAPKWIVDSFENISWKNDACPSFQVSQHVRLYVDHVSPDKRESAPIERFLVSLYDTDGDWIEDLLETSCQAELIETIQQHFAVEYGDL